jgi:Fe-S-cluster containining protein
MATWQCVKNCGACCYLEPSDRPELDQYLSPEELEHYFSLVGPDGWCVNYDGQTRECRIYADRPRFCRVRADVFIDLYDIEAEELNDFAIDCCVQHIEDMYGPESPEMNRFNQTVGVETE